MKNFAGLSVSFGINLDGLGCRQHTQHPARKRRIGPQHEHCGENAIAPKNRAEPWNSRERVRTTFGRSYERVDIRSRATHDLVEQLARTLDRRHVGCHPAPASPAAAIGTEEIRNVLSHTREIFNFLFATRDGREYRRRSARREIQINSRTTSFENNGARGEANQSPPADPVEAQIMKFNAIWGDHTRRHAAPRFAPHPSDFKKVVKIGVEQIIKPEPPRDRREVLHPQALVHGPLPEKFCAFDEDRLPCKTILSRSEVRVCKIHRQGRFVVMRSRAEQLQLFAIQTQFEIRKKPGVSKEQPFRCTRPSSEITAAVQNGKSFAILQICKGRSVKEAVAPISSAAASRVVGSCMVQIPGDSRRKSGGNSKASAGSATRRQSMGSAMFLIEECSDEPMVEPR